MARGNSQGIVKSTRIETIDAAKLERMDEMKTISTYLEKHDISLIDIPLLEDERWVKLSTPIYSLIAPYYMISTKGRFYNTITKRLLKPSCADPDKCESPYYSVCLQIHINGMCISKKFLVHRLLMCIFCPTDHMDKLQVNHKDGNKLNNDLNNLEWVTPQENAIHARDHKLTNPAHGENHCCATLTEAEVREIINLLLSRKYTHIEIAEIMGTSESIVDSIASKKAWKHITKDMDFSSLKQRPPKCFTFDQIRGCCDYFVTHPKPDDVSVRKHAIRAMIYINYDKEYTEGAINSITFLYKRKRYVEISNNYNF